MESISSLDQGDVTMGGGLERRAEAFEPSGLTDDAFLDGRVRLLQPKQGYRAATDPVLLAAAAAPKPGQTVLDLGCGVGAAAFCLAARASGLSLTGLELQPALCRAFSPERRPQWRAGEILLAGVRRRRRRPAAGVAGAEF